MKKISYLLIAMLSIAFVGDAMARRSGGSRSSSSSRSSSWGSSSKSSSSKSSGWGSSSKSKSTAPRSAPAKAKTMHPAPKKTTVKKIVPKKPISAADKKRIASAKSSGKYHKDKKSAQAAFKKNNAGKFPSKYATKPTERPSHVPQSTSVGGKSYNVTFNSTHGGYGYMGPSGSWMMYDAMSDIVMMNMMMQRRGYVIESNYYDTRTVSRPVVVEHRSSGCSIGAASTASLLPMLLVLAGLGVTRFRSKQ